MVPDARPEQERDDDEGAEERPNHDALVPIGVLNIIDPNNLKVNKLVKSKQTGPGAGAARGLPSPLLSGKSADEMSFEST